jgi:DNA modification methylase
MQNYELKQTPLSDLKPHPKNPRKHPEGMIEKLVRSIKEFGFTNPVLIDKDNRILAGHARTIAATRMGLQTVPTIVLPLCGAAADAYVIVDNKLNELSGWDTELLTAMLKDLEKNGFDLSLTGFEATETSELFGKGAIENAHEDDFDTNKAIEESEGEPISKRGDLWEFGKSRLLCGDCTSAEDVARLMKGETADIMLTDPPYNVDYAETQDARERAGYTQPNHGDMKNDKLGDGEFRAFLLAFYKEAYKVLKNGAAIYVFHSSKEAINFITALKEAGFKWSQTLTWVKNHFSLGLSDYQWITEPILYGWKEGAQHFFINDRTKATAYEDAQLDFKKLSKDELREVLERIFGTTKTPAVRCDTPVRSVQHPTMKPIILCAELLFNSSRIGDLVYEPFCGSGSTLIAAEQLSRRCYAIEIEPNYCDVAIKRFHNSFPNIRIRLNGNPFDAEKAFSKVDK